ncbi:MAG TPA: SAM-dependent methyltransferase [Candidatus Nanoarchaeia archaeon]|nr:SAM-dependent methyltransferase [Candidatus Nanoarchaeia archaeon]
MIWVYIIVFIFALTFLYASWRAAPWLPMYANDVARVIDLAKIKEGEKFFDLGAGDGRTLFAAAGAGAISEGFEISLLPYLITKIKILCSPKKNKPKIFFRDFWKINLSEADVIFVFLMPRIMEKLKEKMEKELKPGARIICYTWPMPGWEPAAVDDIPGRLKIYLYKK